MSKEVNFFIPEYVSGRIKFYRYMDTLLSHKSDSKTECILFILISYTQLISGFFNEQVGILKNEETPDNYFMLLQKVIRIRDLFINSYGVYCILLYIFFILLLVFTIIFIYRMKQTGRVAQYSIFEAILNFSIKAFIYVLYQPILDFCLSLLCFGDKNPNFEDDSVTCSISDNIFLYVIMVITFFYTIFLGIFFSLYYNESFLLSNSPMSRITTNYELYLNINAVIFSIILCFTYSIGSIVFILYNMIMSFVLLNYYISSRPFYDSTISYLIGFFHMLYAWTSIFTLLFYFIRVYQASIVYISILLILIWMHYNLHQKMNDVITLEKPFHQLNDKFSILLYIRYIINKYKTMETNPEDKAKIIGIIHLHKRECPMGECPSKLDKKRFYLPITDEWSNPNKMEFNDNVYLQNFIIFIYDYFISQNYFDNDILINLSMYYLQSIGNYCRAMFYHQKAGDNKMNIEQRFLHFRAGELISKALIKSCRPSNEIAGNLEDINFSQYFKYHNLAEKFKVNLIRDVHLSKDFWKLFITKDKKRRKLDFNEIFELTDKIRLTKQTIDKLWDDIFQTYNGYNELFELYENYVECINDDSLTLRELLKTKNKNFALEGIFNYYNTLFNNDTCIVICSGDKGKEGNIEKVSSNISQFFGYKEEEVKGINIGALMPKMFEREHKSFMQRHIRIGEKRIIDKTFRTYGKDKYNALIVINLSVKLFPILGENIFFCAMMTREDIEDVILLDSEYNIQAMSGKLYNLFSLNSQIFQDVDVPFWMICKEFIRHYQTFMMNNSKVKNFSNSQIKLKKNASKNIKNEGYSTQINEKADMKEGEMTQRSEATVKEGNQIEVTELDFEINENAEVEWEIVIPPIFKTFISSTTTKKKYTNKTFAQATNDDYMMNNYTEDDQDETGHLLNKNKNNNQNVDSSDINKSNTQTYAGNNEQDKNFQNAIGKYRAFFTSGNKSNFAELIKIMDKMNERADQVFKFIISFNQLIYSERRTAYVIRCIDNKETADSKSSENRNNGDGIERKNSKNKNIGNITVDVSETRKEVFDRSKYLKDMNEIVNKSEIQVLKMKTNIDQLHMLADTNAELRKLIDNFHREILKYSRVLGINNINVYDENGSQSSSQTGYTNSITKKTRIQEIKSHIMSNVDNFYTLILIKLLFFAFMVCTLFIGIFYLIKFKNLMQSIQEVDLLHSSTIKLGFNFIDFLTRINSFIALSKIRNDFNDTIIYNVYTSNNMSNISEAYGDFIEKEEAKIKRLVDDLEDLSYKVMFYFSDSITDFQQREYYFQFIPYYKGKDANAGGEISFPLSIELYTSILFRLSNTEKLYFPFKFPEDDINNSVKNVTEYLSFIALDNPYLTVIPYMLSLINNNTRVCSQENNIGGFNIYLITIIYCCITFFFSGFYSLCLYLTNKNMEEGMLKMSKIDPKLIAETIKTIEMFNRNVLNKYIEFSDKEQNKSNNNKKLKRGISLTSLNHYNENEENDKKENKKKSKKRIDENDNEKSKFEEDSKKNKNENNDNKNNKNENEQKKEEDKKKNPNNNKNKKKEEDEGLSYYDSKIYKRLKVLSWSYFQSLFLIIIFAIFVLALLLRLKQYLETIEFLFITKDYFSFEHIKIELEILNMKIKMSQRQVNDSDFYDLDNYAKNQQSLIIKIYQQIAYHKALNEFYEKKYISNICQVLYDESSDNYTICKSDSKIGESSNVEEVKYIVNQELDNIWREYRLKNGIEENYTSFQEFASPSYALLEYINNEYLSKIINIYCEIIQKSNEEYGISVEMNIRTIIIFMVLMLWIFCLYVIFFYIQNLIHLLLISRCIFKIIPTRVINQTKDLEDWIDDKY